MRMSSFAGTAVVRLAIAQALVAVAIGSGTTATGQTPDGPDVDSRLTAVVAAARQRSPTFRQQWDRVVSEKALRLVVRIVPDRDLGGARALSRIAVDPDGRVTATVCVPVSPHLVELLAHELEHVLEHLDGVQVAGRHRDGDSSVIPGDRGYETTRARLVGLRAWNEFRAHPAAP